jgi:glycine/D-amino acid oxidase-like deaminating enzyme
MAVRAMQLWLEHEKRWQCRLLHRTGVLWMAAADDDQFERGSLPLLREAGIPYEELSNKEMARRWPQINLEDVRWGIYEPDGGFLEARGACQAVRDGFLAEGGTYQQAAVVWRELEGLKWDALTVSDGSMLKADVYVFACGPWLSSLFPKIIGDRIRVTRQDVFFFGTPAGDDRFSESKLPVWGDHRAHFMYGIPGDPAGFKIADDTRGPEFDPTNGERVASTEGLRAIRDYLGFRFPALKDAPLLETQVCQYENSPDNHFIVDRHPERKDIWLVGGGSGHGFKHGPAVGEMVAKLVMEEKDADPLFRLARFGVLS